MIDLLPHFIFVKDREGRLLLANRVLAVSYGKTVEEVVGQLHADIHAQADEVGRMLKDDLAVIDSGEPIFNKRESLRDLNGDVRILETTKIPYTPTGSNIPAIMGFSIDITERTATERRLLEAEHLASIGTLSAGIAHQINNPIGAIMVAAEFGAMTLDRGGTPAQVRACFEDIVSEAQRCGKIVRDVLSFSRIDQAEKKIENLGLIVERTCKLVASYAHEHGVDLCSESSEADVLARISPIEIEQVIVNVLRNGVESGAKRVLIKCDVRAGEVVIVIQDDGPGIPDDQVEKIFDPFFTTRLGKGGSGLGLSVAQGVVKAHGGRIEVQSSQAGTRFAIHLPVPLESNETPT